MSKYVSMPLPLTKTQKAKIVSSMKHQMPVSVRLTAKTLASGYTLTPLLVTAQQAKKIATAASKGIGAQINLSVAQLKANMKQGSGIFRTIGQKVLRPIAHSGIDFLANAGASMAKKGVDKLVGEGVRRRRKIVRGNGLFGSIARAVVKPVAHAGIDLVSNAVTGAAKAGVNKLVGDGTRRRRTRRAGRGLGPPSYRI